MINEPKDNPEDFSHDEYELEMLGITKGVERWHAPIKSGQLGEWQTAPGRKVVSGWLDKMIEAIEDEQVACITSVGGVGRLNYGPMLMWGDADKLALITISTLFDCAVKDNREVNGLLKPPTDQHVCKMIGQRVKTQYTIDEIRQYEPKFVALAEKITKNWKPRAVRWLKEKTGRATKAWTHKDYTCVGSILLRLTLENTPLFERRMVVEEGYKRKYLVRLSDEARDLYNKHTEIAELRMPVLNPMVVPPRPVREGGPFCYVPTTHIKSHRTPYLPKDADQCLDVLDFNNNVPWRVEPRTVDVMKRLYTQGNRGVMVDGDYIVPPMGDLVLPMRDKERMEIDEEYAKTWRSEAAKVYSANIKLNSKRMEFESAMKQGDKFTKYDRFFFTYQNGWRGRYYPDQSNMQPQGSDPGRGMLISGRAEPLGESGINWLKVHIANLFGIDKVPYNDRIAWVDEHERDLMDSGRHPEEGDRFWMTADDPWQALTAIFQYADINDSARWKDYLCSIVCKIDGTCNGLQHLSAMGRDAEAGLLVNLVPGPKPEDIYRAVGEKLWLAVQRDYLEHVNDSGTHDSLYWYNILKVPENRRKVAKRGTMTTPYGVTAQGLRDQLIAEDWADSWEQAEYLKGHLDRAIRSVVVKGKMFMDWLHKLADMTAGPWTWTSDTGFPTHMDYKAVDKKKIKTAFGDMQTRPFIDETDKRRQIRGSTPNVVHSFDAEHYRLVCLEMMRREHNVIQGVHDAYGTIPCWMNDLAFIAPNTFVDLHETDPHLMLLEELRQQYPELELPDPPKIGELVLDDIRKSRYAFS